MTEMQLREVQSPKCVGTQKVAPGGIDNLDHFGELVVCEHSTCNNAFFNKTGYNGMLRGGLLRHYCSVSCKSKTRDKNEMQLRAENRELKQRLANYAWARLNRDRAFAFDGRYEGTTTEPITVVYGMRKDTGYVAMPIDVHVEPRQPKFNQVTPEDVTWALKQRGVPHSLPMPRLLKTYCACCREAVIDGTREVRVTKGCYLPVDHECPRTRVYDIRGALLEVL